MSNMRIQQFVVGPVSTNCYFAINDKTKETIIVDPGASANRLYEMILSDGLTPIAILLTHGHFDHAGGVAGLKELAAEKGYSVPIYAYEAEKETLRNPAINLSGNMMGSPESYEADIFLHDGEEITLAGFLMRTIFTPGHTPGGCCFYFPDEGVLFSGDTLFNGSVGRSDFPSGSASVLVRSIREKLLCLPDDTTVCPGHDARTTIGDEKKYNPFIV